MVSIILGDQTMRVKLGYTVEEEDILPETAKILGLSQDDMKHAIDMFQAVQTELTSGSDEAPANTIRVLDMIDDFRKALLAVDTRLQECTEIIEGYDDYRTQKRKGKLPVEAEETAYEAEAFGAD
tara:strand:- start:1045 stop:1419 length:375 start_codon:yes stop_codon:yes gene_type:complete